MVSCLKRREKVPFYSHLLDKARYNSRIAEKLKVLGWHSRVLEPFGSTLEALANEDSLKLKNLYSPITLNETSKELEMISLVRESTELIQRCVKMHADLEGSFKASAI